MSAVTLPNPPKLTLHNDAYTTTFRDLYRNFVQTPRPGLRN